MNVHYRQMLAGGHQLAQEAIHPLKLHEKLHMFHKKANP